jgi:hypothetical protein
MELEVVFEVLGQIDVEVVFVFVVVVVVIGGG